MYFKDDLRQPYNDDNIFSFMKIKLSPNLLCVNVILAPIFKRKLDFKSSLIILMYHMTLINYFYTSIDRSKLLQQN